MINDNELYREVGRVPDVPSHLYENIRREVRRRSFFARSALALAAALVLSIGTAPFWLAREKIDAGITPELADELQTVSDYASGAGLTSDLALYAFYDEETSMRQPGD